MKFTVLTTQHIEALSAIVGDKNTIKSTAQLQTYAKDETEDLSYMPEVALKPTDTEQVSRILKYCNEHHIPVTPRGAGTGLAGGCLPVAGGVVLLSEGLNQIIDIDEANLQVTTQPGVITEVLQSAVAEKGLFYPPDPASKGSCFIGGNIANNSGGPKAVKYGVVKDYVLNLEVVLPNGDVIETGANVLKNSTGYNLTQLIVGSEGTLGFVTKIVLRLIPKPTLNLCMLVPFYNVLEACEAVSAIFHAGLTPSGLELMERNAILWSAEYLGITDTLNLPKEVEAHLLIEVDGHQLRVLEEECTQIATVLESYDCGEVLFADNEAQKETLWRLRRNVSHAVKKHSIYKEEDTVVPRAHLPQLFKAVKEIGNQFGFESVCYGHAGDGNLHVNIIKGQLTDKAWNEDLPKAIALIFEKVKALGGTISGEHGIGWVQKNYMPIVFNQAELALLKGIKSLFDPKGIMNPGKIHPGQVDV